jgi:hypothetical protein
MWAEGVKLFENSNPCGKTHTMYVRWMDRCVAMDREAAIDKRRFVYKP